MPLRSLKPMPNSRVATSKQAAMTRSSCRYGFSSASSKANFRARSFSW